MKLMKKRHTCSISLRIRRWYKYAMVISSSYIEIRIVTKYIHTSYLGRRICAPASIIKLSNDPKSEWNMVVICFGLISWKFFTSVIFHATRADYNLFVFIVHHISYIYKYTVYSYVFYVGTSTLRCTHTSTRRTRDFNKAFSTQNYALNKIQ